MSVTAAEQLAVSPVPSVGLFENADCRTTRTGLYMAPLGMVHTQQLFQRPFFFKVPTSAVSVGALTSGYRGCEVPLCRLQGPVKPQNH